MPFKIIQHLSCSVFDIVGVWRIDTWGDVLFVSMVVVPPSRQTNVKFSSEMTRVFAGELGSSTRVCKHSTSPPAEVDPPLQLRQSVRLCGLRLGRWSLLIACFAP